MKEYDRMRLWEVCFDRELFRNELERIVTTTPKHEILEVLKYCYEKYSSEYADILYDVFSSYVKTHRIDKLVYPS
jgi:hypothetical protein